MIKIDYNNWRLRSGNRDRTRIRAGRSAFGCGQAKASWRRTAVLGDGRFAVRGVWGGQKEKRANHRVM